MLFYGCCVQENKNKEIKIFTPKIIINSNLEYYVYDVHLNQKIDAPFINKGFINKKFKYTVPWQYNMSTEQDE